MCFNDNVMCFLSIKFIFEKFEKEKKVKVVVVEV